MISGQLLLARRLALALGNIASDAMLERFGLSLPRTPEQLAQADVVNALVRESAPSDTAALPTVKSVRLPGVDFESSNCRNFLLEVDFDDVQPGEPAPPRTLYAKLPCAELATRAFANAVGFWQVEEAYCLQVAQHTPIRVPRVYAVARRGARFVLLLENLHETPGTKLFDNRDMAAGTDPDRALMCLRTFAELHAGFTGWNDRSREALFPNRLHTYLAPGGRNVTKALNASAVNGAHKKAPDVFTEAHVELCRAAFEKWDRLLAYWYREPLTLIHGDSHLANCFEYPTDEGPRMGMIDFQGMQWCKGVRDVQYFLINSIEPETLAPCEDELLSFYVEALAEHSLKLDLAEAKEQYRAFSFQTLMVAVVSLGLGSLTERDDTVRTILRRSVAAVDRLGFREFLERL